jgi:hypothetical protein
MGLLDPDRVRAALGPRLGDKFLQYATPPGADEPGRLLVRIDEHVAGARGDVVLATQIALACKRLLLRVEGAAPDEACAILAAARYFIDTYDLARDDGPRGYVDDAAVVEYVTAALK